MLPSDSENDTVSHRPGAMAVRVILLLFNQRHIYDTLFLQMAVLFLISEQSTGQYMSWSFEGNILGIGP